MQIKIWNQLFEIPHDKMSYYSGARQEGDWKDQYKLDTGFNIS